MSISGKKFAITGAGRGLGAALAIVMADLGVNLILLGRDTGTLAETADAIHKRSGRVAETLFCDLSDAGSCSEAGDVLARRHPDLDGLVHNGAMWLPGILENTSDVDIQTCISSAAIGSLVLTRHVLPVLSARPASDIHIVVSTSGLNNAPLSGTSIAFRAAKAAQDGLVQGLAEELKHTRIRVTAVYPGDFADVSPLDPAWTDGSQSDGSLTNRQVTECILFALNLPQNAAVRKLVVQ